VLGFSRIAEGKSAAALLLRKLTRIFSGYLTAGGAVSARQTGIQ
jgi:hypothetical protein